MRSNNTVWLFRALSCLRRVWAGVLSLICRSQGSISGQITIPIFQKTVCTKIYLIIISFAVNLSWSVEPSPWSVFNSELKFNPTCSTVPFWVINPKSWVSSPPDNLSNSAELDLGRIWGSDTGIGLFLNHLTFISNCHKTSCLPVSLFIP